MGIFSINADPKLFDNPTGRDDPTVAPSSDYPTAAAPAAAPSGQSFGNIMSAIGLGLSATAGGWQGDTDVVQRAMAQKQRTQALQQQQELEKVKMMPDIIKMLGDIQDNLAPDQHESALKSLQPLVSKIFPDWDLSKLASGAAGKASDLIKALPAAEVLYSQQELPKFAELFRKDPGKARNDMSARAVNHALSSVDKGEPIDPKVDQAIFTEGDRKRVDTRYGQMSIQRLLLTADDPVKGPELKKLDRASLIKIAPGLAHATNDQWADVINVGFSNVKTTKMTEDEAHDKIVDQNRILAETAINERQNKQINASEERQNRAIAASDARQATAIAAADERTRAHIGAADAARRENEQNAPLDLKANRWVHPVTLETASPDMTPAEARAHGFGVIPSTLSQAVPSARTSLKILDKYEELSRKLLVDTTGMNTAQSIAAIQANKVKLKAKELAGDKDVKEFLSLQAALPTQVKAFGDTGNIAVRETEFQGKAMATFDDSKESGLNKVRTRRDLLKQVVRSNISSTANTSAAAPTAAAQPKATMRYNPATGKVEPIK